MVRKKRDELDMPIYKHELPSTNVIIQLNYRFYQRSLKRPKKGQEAPIYLTHGLPKSRMKKMILEPDPDVYSYINQIRISFPEDMDIYSKSAYWYRAFSRGQLFPDANHRTGFFSWKQILNSKGLDINANAYEIASLTESIKCMGYIKQGQMVVNLIEKDEEYEMLKRWFKDRLELR